MRSMFLASLGHRQTLSARPDEALALVAQSVEPSTFALSPQHPFPFLFLAMAYREAGQSGRSTKTAVEALRLAEARRDGGARAWALYVLGSISVLRQPLDAEPVHGHYTRAMALAVDLGMRPLIAHCHLGLGTLHARLGNSEQANEGAGRAISMYREMGMTYWLERATTEMKNLERRDRP
jgi:hypothetical protein